MYIPGYGNVLEADFSKPVDPNRMAPGVSQPKPAANPPGLSGAYQAPYQQETAQPKSPLQEYSSRGSLGPYAGGQPGPRDAQLPANWGDSYGSASTTVFNFPEPPEYSRVAKPLSAELLQAFGQRRLAADQAYQNALAQESAGIGRFNASFAAAKERLDNEYNRASKRVARELAGKGLARSPMVRGRQERELGQVVSEQLGEMKLNLATEIEALQQASENARIERLNIMAQIEQEEALARSQSYDYVRIN